MGAKGVSPIAALILGIALALLYLVCRYGPALLIGWRMRKGNYTASEEKQIEKQLRQLGYID